MTSAAATARVRGSNAISDETMWADPEDPLLDPYRRSKIIAERAAWDFIATHGDRTSLVTILPGAVFGPLLPGGERSSVWVIKNLLDGRPPRLLNLGLSVVDVRDLAAAHVTALTAPQAAGERFLCTGHFMWMPQMARQLRDGLAAAGFADAAARVPTRSVPDWLIGPMSLAMKQLRMFRHDIGRRYVADNGKAARVLGFAPRPSVETLTDCARSLIAA
jgi:nucleoside-diphosphate-sugar epimerase